MCQVCLSYIGSNGAPCVAAGLLNDSLQPQPQAVAERFVCLIRRLEGHHTR